MGMITFKRWKEPIVSGPAEPVYINSEAIDVVTPLPDGTEIVTRTGFKTRVEEDKEQVLKLIRLAKTAR